MQVVEGVADVLLARIPFYFFIKAAFLVYLYYPSTQGAKVVYEQVVKVYIVPKGLSHSSTKKEE
jgi:receptor expression-enhancing protein 5/6